MKTIRSQQITISPAVPNDVVGIQEVFYRAWLVTYPNEDLGITKEDVEDRYKDRLQPETLEKRRYLIINQLEEETFLIAKEKGKVIGLCKIIRYPDYNELEALYILPKCQGRGVGTRLWNEVQDSINHSVKTVVHVATYNANTIKFYEGLGFMATGKTWHNEKYRMKSGAIIPEMEMVLEAS